MAAPLAVLALAGPASAAVTTEGFDTVTPAGWTAINNSSPVGSTGVFQGNNVAAGGPFDAQAGAPNSYAGMNYNNTGSIGTISTWLVTPKYTSLSNGDVMSFFTRKASPDTYADRLEVRMSTNGSCNPGTGSASVGDFTSLLLTVNPSLTLGVYPTTWTQLSATLSGIAGAKSGCFAFRYYVTGAGLNGTNSDYIGIDTYAYDDQPTDVTPPDTTISSGPTPGLPTNDSTPTFTFGSSEAGSTFTCRVDSDPFAACASPLTTAALTDGSHTFEVRATDLAGNTDPSPAATTFTVDTAAPETTIDSAPGTSTNDATPTFTFSSSEAGSTFACRVDADPFASCTSPLTSAALPDGPHTFEVRATDTAGNADASPASASFTVDTVAPETSITGGPASGATTGDSTPTFEFASSQAGSTFECRVDADAFASCASPFTAAPVADGAHTFEVRATDAAGNIDASAATTSFVVDATAPDTAITSGPANGSTTQDTTPTFGFSSTDPGATFACSVDGGAFGPCSGPAGTHTTAALALGAHTFSVQATDAVGNTDASPATSAFTVAAPSTTPPADCTPQATALAKAKAGLAKAKTKLKKAKKTGTAQAVKKAKAKVKKAKAKVKRATAALAACQAG